MTKEKFIQEIVNWSVLTALVVLALPGDVVAQTVGDSLGVIEGQSTGVTPIISIVAYTAGAFLGVSGALKLKAYSEAPQGNKLAPAIGQLGVAGALVALPTLLGTLNDSLGLDGTTKANVIRID